MEDIKVSIITVVRNGVRTIERTIKSVLNQTYHNIEYIIIDGASDDGTQRVIEKYADHIAYYVSEPDNGIYDAMNKGLFKVTGDVIGILNSDDWYELNAVEIVVNAFAPGVSVVAGQGMITNANTVRRSVQHDIADIWYGMPIMHPATFVRKTVYERYGVFDTQYRIAADYDFFLRLFVNKVEFCILDDVIVYFSEGGISTREFIETAKESNTIRRRYIHLREGGFDVDSYNRREIEIAYLSELCAKNPKQIITFIRKNLGDSVNIFGCGYWGIKLMDCLKTSNISVISLFDNDVNKHGTKINGVEILNPEIVKEGEWKLILAMWETIAVERQLQSYNNSSLKWITLQDALKDNYYDVDL